MACICPRVSGLYCFFGYLLFFFLILAPLFLIRVCHAQITSFEYAYDRLLAERFDNRPGDIRILGNPNQVSGPVYIETVCVKTSLGQGPGWLFSFADSSTKTAFHYVAFVSVSGEVTQKVFKRIPLNLTGYVLMDNIRSDKFSGTANLISEKQAYDWLVDRLLGHAVGNRRIYVYPDKFQGSVTSENAKGRIDMGEGSGWLFFIDDAPQANWEHACRFVLVNETGDIIVKQATLPPTDLHLFRELTTPVPEPGYRINQLKPLGILRERDIKLAHLETTPAERRWAVIISGGINSSSNHVRYWNDCSFFYETLMDHGFLDDHVYVLISDGTSTALDRSNNTNSPLDLDGDGDNDTGFSATAANITDVFDDLERDLDQDDILYIFTTNHGGSDDACPWDDPDVHLWLWNNTSISDADFAQEVNRVTTLATVCIFEQCFSGGMLDDLYGQNRVLISASRFWELSYGGSGNATDYDEFSYYLTHALANPGDADANEDDVVSMEESYLYALAHDTVQSEGLASVPCGDNGGEHPSYYSNPWDLGRRLSLYGIEENTPYNPLLGTYAQTRGYTQTEVQETFPTGGTARNWRADDSFWEFSLPFSFPYGGQAYSRIWVDSNGIIYLNNPGSSDWQNSVSGLIGKRAIAPLWDDLTTAISGDDIFTSSSSDWVTIRWQAHTRWDALARPVNIAVKLGRDGPIRFLYGSGNNHTSRIQQRDKTIGISLGNNSYHLCLRNGSGNLGNANGIEYLPYSVVYVDGNHGGAELGTKLYPYNTVSEGYNAIAKYGTLSIRGGSYSGSQNVPITLQKPITTRSYGGNTIIGEP